MKSDSSIITRFRNSISAQSIRNGLTLAIPFLIMGSFSLLLRNFPNDTYQSFLERFLGGGAAVLLETLYTVSLGSLALVLSITISLSYGLLAQTDTFLLYPVVSVCSYLAFCGGIEGHDEYVFKAEWVFTAMCITLFSCILLKWMLKLGSRFKKLHATGAEYLFNISIQSLLPVVVIIIGFGIISRKSYGLEHVRPTMEMTERSAMIISDTLMEDMSILKSSGISFSLDDFGMGHNSIVYLQEKIFDEVKLDGKLVSQLPENERSKDILSGIISMAQSLNLRVVAEFVETEEQRDMLQSLGCDIYQGYYYSRPLSLTDLAEYIEEHC